ncbi:MAG: hypothetical protein AAB254_00160, partial [candidate division NC10 bacterium]
VIPAVHSYGGIVLHAVVNADSPQLPFRAAWEELFQGHLLSGFATTLAGAFLSALNAVLSHGG